MLLKCFNNQVVIDELPEIPKGNIQYFLTRPFATTPEYRKSPPWFHFNTTKIIKKLMSHKLVNSVPERCFNILQRNTIIRLLNGNELTVVPIETNSASGNIMLLFHYKNNYILYTGESAICNSIYSHPDIKNCIRDQSISCVYLDNTLAFAEETITMDDACVKIMKLIKLYPECKFVIIADSSGYEDILLKLAKDYAVKIYLNNFRKFLFDSFEEQAQYVLNNTEATIIVKTVNEEPKLEDYQKFFQLNKTLIIRFVTTGRQFIEDMQPFNGICIVAYSPHPSIQEMQTLLSKIQPDYVYPIVHDAYVNLNVERRLRFPKILTDLCSKMEEFASSTIDDEFPGMVSEPWVSSYYNFGHLSSIPHVHAEATHSILPQHSTTSRQGSQEEKAKSILSSSNYSTSLSSEDENEDQPELNLSHMQSHFFSRLETTLRDNINALNATSVYDLSCKQPSIFKNKVERKKMYASQRLLHTAQKPIVYDSESDGEVNATSPKRRNNVSDLTNTRPSTTDDVASESSDILIPPELQFTLDRPQ